jgi:hypothetical protein
MARLSVGSSWATLTEAQRQQVTESFGRYISAIYADRFDSYAGQQLQVTGEHPAAAGVMVRSQIVKANGELVKVDYMMRRDGNSWLISDIYLDGAISELATRHSEFAAILKSQGIDGLIAALNRKADILTATTAKASVAAFPKDLACCNAGGGLRCCHRLLRNSFRVASQPNPLDLVLSEPSLPRALDAAGRRSQISHLDGRQPAAAGHLRGPARGQAGGRSPPPGAASKPVIALFQPAGAKPLSACRGGDRRAA